MENITIAEKFKANWSFNLTQAQLDIAQGGQSIFNQQLYKYDEYGEVLEEEALEKVEVITKDIARGTPSVADDVKSVQLGLSTKSSKVYPLIQSQSHITGSQLNKRIPGLEVPYSDSNLNKFAKTYYLAQRNLTVMLEEISRTAETMCWEVLQSGKLITQNGTLDYRRSPKLTGKTVKVAWSDNASNPHEDLGNALKVLTQTGKNVNSGMPLAIMGDSAWENFKNIIRGMKQQDGIKLIDTNIAPFDAPTDSAFLGANGFEYQGWIITSFGGKKIHLYTYPKYYASTPSTETDSTTPYVSDNLCTIMYYQKKYFQMFYGANENMPSANDIGSAFFGTIPMPLADTTANGIGSSFIPAIAMDLKFKVYDYDKGVGMLLEVAPLPIVQHRNCVVSIDTSVNTSPIGA